MPSRLWFARLPYSFVRCNVSRDNVNQGWMMDYHTELEWTRNSRMWAEQRALVAEGALKAIAAEHIAAHEAQRITAGDAVVLAGFLRLLGLTPETGSVCLWQLVREHPCVAHSVSEEWEALASEGVIELECAWPTSDGAVVTYNAGWAPGSKRLRAELENVAYEAASWLSGVECV